ncbi:MAG: hypothetical protein HN916_18350 [Anaerolineae bacterium]|nr:hypothetical protein [Anaerolineae bacterium]
MDSSDYGRNDDIDAIVNALGKNVEVLILDKLVEDARAIKDELEKYINKITKKEQ